MAKASKELRAKVAGSCALSQVIASAIWNYDFPQEIADTKEETQWCAGFEDARDAFLDSLRPLDPIRQEYERLQERSK